MGSQAEAGKQESATGSPEGASAAECAPGWGSLTAGQDDTQRPWHLGWPRGRNRAREIWKAGKGRARRNGEVEKREGAKTGREALKKEAGRQTQGGT